MIILAGDVGGTNTRLQLTEHNPHAADLFGTKDVHGQHVDDTPRSMQASDCGSASSSIYRSNYKNTVKVLHTQRYKAADYNGLEEIIDLFLQESGLDKKKHKIEACCIAVAGPVVAGEVEFTNLPWGIHERDLARGLGLDVSRVKLINDFVANGYGIETLEIKIDKTSSSPPTLERVLQQHPDVLCLQEPLETISDEERMSTPIATIGAGTGLGYGIVTRCPLTGHTTSVFPSEGGHMDFAPVDDEQLGLFHHLRRKLHRVSAERICCGPGIVNIYSYCKENPLYNSPENPQLRRELCRVREVDKPALIFKYVQEKDPMCLRTMDIFIKVYGALAGNWALGVLPKQGLFILGGIGPRIAKEMSDGRFIDKFRDKGRMSGLVRNIPVYLVLNGDVGLQGAAVYASRLVPHPPEPTAAAPAERSPGAASRTPGTKSRRLYESHKSHLDSHEHDGTAASIEHSTLNKGSCSGDVVEG
ncbi:unnamed protein product [Amoebophrya sp. A25]|nr:unnamed protein product [Amoebophrya sp. A25]|eukprot:GSA25T00003409001.1